METNFNSTLVDIISFGMNAPGIASISNIPKGKYKSIKFVLDAHHGNAWINEESFGFHFTNSTQIEMKGNFEVITGFTTNLKLNFDLSQLQYNYSENSFTLPNQIATIKKASFELPYTPGILIVKLTKPIENIDSNKVGLQEIDAILEKYSLLSILPFVADDTNVDPETAKLIGLDRTYFLLFEARVDLLQVNFALTNKPGIEWATTNSKSEPDMVPDDPEANTGCFFCSKFQSAYLTAINAYNGWNITTGSSGVKIAVIDTEIDDTHPDLMGKIIQNRSFLPATCYHWGIFPYECVTHLEVSSPFYNGAQGWDHVTHVAGNKPSSSDRLVAYGILEAVNVGAKVINMSLGGEAYVYCQWACLVRVFTYSLTRDAVRYAEAKRVTMVASSGNDNRRIASFPGTAEFSGSYPASYNEVISVGNLDSAFSYTRKNISSNYGKVDISAPGTSIFSTSTNGNYVFKTGTSMAAPMVSGLAALILSIDSNYHSKDILKSMCNQATPLTQTGNTSIDREYFGCGRINIGATLTALVPSPQRPNIVADCGAVDQIACPAGRWFLPWDFQFVASGGTPPYSWSYEGGGLPTNSWLDPNTGRLVGGATWWFGPGWTFMLRVTDSAGQSDIRSFYFASGL
nr:S8 family serine peptidase [Leptospira ellinghausenii]